MKIFFRTLFCKYDLIYVHLISHSTLPLRLVNTFRRLPLIFNIHGEDLLVTTPLAAKLLKIALPLVLKSKWLVVPSHYFKKITTEYLPTYPSNRIIVSASGGVKESFKPKTGKSETHAVPRIGYVSRIDRGKGWRTLVESIKILKDRNIHPEVSIVGGGPQETELKKLMEDYQLTNVQFIGPIAHDDLPSFYQNLDLFIFPTELRESLGLVGLEAMACGVPVIGSEIGGLTDYIRPEYNGFFFEPGNPRELASRIETFLNLPEEKRKELALHAIATAEEYRDEKVAKKLFDNIL